MNFRNVLTGVVIQTSLLAAFAQAQSLWPWQADSKLVAPDAEPDDRAGAAIAAQGALLLVGAPNDDEAGVDAGAVYVYHDVGGSWAYDGKLLSPTPRPAGHFGFSIALDGNAAVIGSPSLTTAVPGDAWLFRWDGAAWLAETRFQSPSAAANFGDAVAISRDAVAIGESNPNAVVRVFERTGATWPLIQTIQSGGQVNVAIDADTMLVTKIGFIQAYQRSASGSWVSTETIPGPINQGVAMAIHDGVCAITRPFTGGLGAWFVDVYDFDPTSGSQFVKSATLQADDQHLTSHNQFGRSLAFARDGAQEEDLLVVGAPRFDFTTKNDGMAHVFARFSDKWTRVARVTASDAATGDEFGRSVAIAGTRVIVGAWQADSPTGDSGATYSYSLVPVPTVYCSAKPNSLGCLPQISGVGAPSVSAGSGFQVGCVDVLPNKFGVLFYSRKSALLPFRGGWLCVEPPLKRAAMQTSDGTDFCTGAYSVDLNVYLASGHDPALVPGATVVCQWATRDPQDAWQSGLSDALWFELGP